MFPTSSAKSERGNKTDSNPCHDNLCRLQEQGCVGFQDDRFLRYWIRFALCRCFLPDVSLELLRFLILIIVLLTS